MSVKEGSEEFASSACSFLTELRTDKTVDWVIVAE
jgi:hypothetical protein